VIAPNKAAEAVSFIARPGGILARHGVDTRGRFAEFHVCELFCGPGETPEATGAYQSCEAVPTRNATPVLVRAERRDEAIALILHEFRRKVFGLAYSFLRNREAAQDVAQDVFIKVWRALPGFDGRASLSTWIYTITRNASLSALRARRPQSSLSDPDVMDAVDATDAAPSADNIVDGVSLQRLVDQLPTKQRQVVMLFYMEEQSHEEVARMLAMPVGTVKTLLHRARARLSAAAIK
jgi:RNA polymerase sigma-70 factor (ECF subfamily)